MIPLHIKNISNLLQVHHQAPLQVVALGDPLLHLVFEVDDEAQMELDLEIKKIVQIYKNRLQCTIF